ncbi:MAG TPA: peroxiredoxin [Phototrophicaceae bacterium]|jgi:peroxiredoxin Q/BCP|nr:peroxiredoxin [Phototrophicaceae bacterium]
MKFPEVGEKSRDFETVTEAGTPVKLSDYSGKRVMLYFYPKADTPGCTKQACSIRDNYQLFNEKDIVVLGCSPDTAEDQLAFKNKYNLPFVLLADADHQISDLYGVWGPYKSTYNGVEYEASGTRRSTFIIEPDGSISYAQYGVDPTKNTAEILELV